MAHDPDSFAGVLDRLIERRAGGIDSLRKLARRLAELKGTALESEKTSIRRHRDSGKVTARALRWYAQALEVDVSEFPPSHERQARALLLEARLEVLEARVEKNAQSAKDALQRLSGDVVRLERRLDDAAPPNEGRGW